ncbi:fimbrial protein [Edwardsiella piscicida]|uniref:fimbrial protein n=1 Tax=Edwardsiella piscicida TaxID=1263550 RepID=UPI001F2BA78E|nr:fimbrial protein [Edwardsiella piscicida]UJT83472.1 fimbrial protein [Edwardsiella piscicida]
MKSLSIKQALAFTLLLLLGLCVSRQASALSCREGSNAGSWSPIGSIYQRIDIGRPIILSAADFTAGNLIWRSQNFTTTFTCWDNWNTGRGEHAYIYWNPKDAFGSLHRSLSVGVSINGIDYDAINLRQSGSRPSGPDLGEGTSNSGGGVARPRTVTVSYSVYIKATGITPPAGNFPALGLPSLFQIDGVGGLDARPNGNFNAYISGLDKIQVIHCNPQISVLANNGNSIDFGTLSAAGARPGVIARQIPFSIKATLRGGECGGQQLQASFSTLRPDVSDRSLILPDTNPGVGIFPTKAGDTSATPIPLQTNVDFGGRLQDKQNEVSENFTANLKWLTNRPTAGRFHATANIDVTFK